LSDQPLSLNRPYVCAGHAIRKAAAELSKKESGSGKHQSAQKRRTTKLKDDFAPATLRAVPIPFHPSMMGYDATSNVDHSLVSVGSRSNRATPSFLGSMDAALQPPMSSSALPTTLNSSPSEHTASNLSSYGTYTSQMDLLMARRDFGTEKTSNAEVGMPYDLVSRYSGSGGGMLPGTIGPDGSHDPSLLLSLQRRQLLVGAVKKQQEAMDMLRQSGEMTRLAQTSAAAQAQLPGSSLGDYVNLGDMAQHERMVAYAAGAQSIGNLMGLAGSMAAPGSAYDPGAFDPQTVMTSHFPTAPSPYASFLTQPAPGQMQLPRVTESGNEYLQLSAGAGDGSVRGSMSRDDRDQLTGRRE
jgi:hypothetical protein